MKEPEPPYYVALTSYLSFALLFIFGHVRDFVRQLLVGRRAGEGAAEGLAPLCKDYEDFYTRRMYMRIHDVFNRPIASAPDAWIEVVEREPAGGRGYELRTTERTRSCLNLGSYNYLGFAAADPYCTQRVRRRAGALAPPPPPASPPLFSPPSHAAQVLDTLSKFGASTCRRARARGARRALARD